MKCSGRIVLCFLLKSYMLNYKLVYLLINIQVHLAFKILGYVLYIREFVNLAKWCI